MRAIFTFIILLVFVVIAITGIYLWVLPPVSTNSQTYKTNPLEKSIELEKVFKNTISCDECGLSQLEH